MTRIVVLIGGTSLLSGCGASAAPTLPPAVMPDTIVLKNFAFDPGGLAVPPGTTITVVNQDAVAHTATAVDGSFDSGQLAPGQRATIIAPRKPGTYFYLSMDQQYITGFIKVIEPQTAHPGSS